MKRTITQFLAHEFATTSHDAIPSSSRAAVQRLIVDHVGITYMGAASTGNAILAYAKELGGPPEAVMIGGGVQVPAELAASVNAQLCRNTDFEETGPGTHVGPLVVHTALAVGQRVGASGRDIIDAATLGYMLTARLHFARREGWPRTSILQHRTVAAAISARLLGYDTEMMARTLSVAWELPPRVHISGGVDFIDKRIYPFALASGLGAPLFGARNGVQAAVMVGHGFESVPDEIDQHLDEYDIEVLTGPAPFHHVEGEMELKPWVSSRPSQGALQAITDLVEAHDISAGDVTGVRVGLSDMYQKGWLNDPTPNNYWEAIYSTQWAVAMVLQRLPAGPKWVSEGRLTDPFSRNLAAMVEITEDPEASRAWWDLDWLSIRGTVEIDVGANTCAAECTLRETYGSPGMDMTEKMVEQKFFESAAPYLGESRSRALLSALLQLDQVADIRDIAPLF